MQRQFPQYLRGLLALGCAICAGTGCEKVATAPTETRVLAADETAAADYEIIGVEPDGFACASVAPLPEVEIAVGVAVENVESAMPTPAGVPRPCSYRGKSPPYPQWSFDLDCRPGAQSTGSEMMVQYSTETGAVAVRVGKSGIDHRDAVLLWIEDDAPCYGRTMGPNRDKRLALGRLVSGNLNERNAPSSVVIRSTK